MNAYFFFGFMVASFCAGLYAEHEFHLAQQAVAAYQQLASAQTGETKIIRDTQTITKDIKNDKDPCLGTPVPSNINKLLH